MWDDSGYDLDDPKHPTFHERYADFADYTRKRDKEQGLLSGPDGSEGALAGGLTSGPENKEENNG